MLRLRQRVIDLDAIRKYTRQATGEKFLIRPVLG